MNEKTMTETITVTRKWVTDEKHALKRVEHTVSDEDGVLFHHLNF